MLVAFSFCSVVGRSFAKNAQDFGRRLPRAKNARSRLLSASNKGQSEKSDWSFPFRARMLEFRTSLLALVSSRDPDLVDLLRGCRIVGAVAEGEDAPFHSNLG